ncbi:MAG: WG repeat-containing protein [Sphingobacteriales bacterium]|nr:MAG: WG repeat-containing protein [Sphingobacteriales bacterium]
MHIRHFILTILVLLFVCSTYGQKKFKVVMTETETWQELYSLVDEKGKTICKLDSSKYYICFTIDSYGYFAIFGMKGFTGWAAINADEKVLFNVYNTSFGEPSPDHLIENKIRITDSSDLIGFANYKGQIVIKPQFEIATNFDKGKAIVGQSCKKIPWGEHAKDSDCHHYSVVCKRHGYINEKGTIIKIGDFSFEQIMKEINWKAPDE